MKRHILRIIADALFYVMIAIIFVFDITMIGFSAIALLIS